MQFLIDHLEEESLTDTDYYLNRSTLELLKHKGLSKGLAKLIQGAMGDDQDIEIRYEKAY